MNFLAHIFLSEGDDEVTVGNFIADSIKGKKYLHYPKGVQTGILLHRAIDTYTDAHPTVRRSTAKLFKNYSHYSGVIVDIYYDHFLAKNWKSYCETDLEVFIADFYRLLKKKEELLPDEVQSFLPYMIRENWLLSYSTLPGIARILYQMNKRTKNVVGMDKAVEDLEKHYEDFQDHFNSFFPDLQKYASQKYWEIKKIEDLR